MKKIIKVLFITFLLILVTGCEEIIPKTDFYMNETAKIDDIEIEMINANYNENGILEVVFKITNERDNTITLSPDNNFKLYDINQVQIPNQYTGNNNIIKKDETINYTLQYNSKRELYEIIFYSGIVENNIKFTVTSMDLK